MTLAQLLALDPAAMWDALPRDSQMAIVVPLLLSEFAAVTAEDDGTDASDGDQHEAARIEHSSFQAAMDAVGDAFPQILGDDLTAVHSGPTAEMFVGDDKVRMKGLKTPRKLHGSRDGASVRLKGRRVPIVGFKNIGTEDAPVWEGWTQAQVDAERVRRHPDQAVGPFQPGFASVVGEAEPDHHHHEDHSYDRAA